MYVYITKGFQFVKGKKCEPFEYLCRNCKQLRLSFVEVKGCSNCGSLDIIKGKVGTLDKGGLK